MNAGIQPALRHDGETTDAVSSRHVCVLVSSCDAYSDAWFPFFQLLDRYWPDCPFPIYLISNTQPVNHSGVTSLTVGADRKWASNTLHAMSSLPFEHIVYFQEDYFLQSPVSTARVERVIEFARHTGAGFIRLAGFPNPDQPHPNSLGLGVLSPTVKFRVSLQAALWQRQTLLDLLVPGESGWDMEIAGTARSRSLTVPFFSVSSRNPVLDYYRHTGILKGKWVPGALRLCQREGITVDTSRRGVHGDWPFLVKDVRDTAVVSTCRTWLRRLRGRAA